MVNATTITRDSRRLFDESLYDALGALGLDVRVEFDLEAWKSFIRGTEWPVVNASVDPARHRFRPGEVLWLHLHADGETVGTQVLRVIETDDYIEMVRSQRVWFGAAPSEFREARMLSEDFPLIAGTVVQLSGLYLDRKWRRARTTAGLRLVGAFVRLTHDFTLRNLAPDWSVTLIEEHVAQPRIVHELYAYPHAAPAFEAVIPYLGKKERLTMAWMSHAELAALSGRPQPAAVPPLRLAATTAG